MSNLAQRPRAIARSVAGEDAPARSSPSGVVALKAVLLKTLEKVAKIVGRRRLAVATQPPPPAQLCRIVVSLGVFTAHRLKFDESQRELATAMVEEATRPDPEFERIEKTYFGRRFFDEDCCKGGDSFEIVDFATSKEFDLICAMVVKLDGSGVMQSRARRVPYLIESEAHQREMGAMIAAYEQRASDATSSPARPRAGTTTVPKPASARALRSKKARR